MIRLYLYAALAAAAVAATWVGYNHVKNIGAEEVWAEVHAQRIKDLEEASRLQAQIAAEHAQSQEKKDAALKTVNSRLVAALGELRLRPERRERLPSSAPTCEGATGAELSGRDAAFLAGYAARAATVAAERDDCYRRYEAVEKARPAGSPFPAASGAVSP
jgi:hypothetical protein